MTPPSQHSRSTIMWATGGLGLAAVSYLGYAGLTYARYGNPPADIGEPDRLLQTFMPDYDVVERHRIRVTAPAEITFVAARDQDLLSSPIVRALFRTRELVLGAKPVVNGPARALLPQVLSLGWGILAEVPGREIVVGAVTRPWEADVVFRALRPEDFAAFAEPGSVKIAWTLRADPLAPGESMFRTEPRAVATDAFARTRFRIYWSFVSPGVALIRRLSLRPLKAEAECRARFNSPPLSARASALDELEVSRDSWRSRESVADAVQ